MISTRKNSLLYKLIIIAGGCVLGNANAATPSCLAPKNAIVAENCLPGNPASEWDIAGAGDPSIQGFATDMSINKGETVAFKIKTDAKNYRLAIYRLGYYNNTGARKVATLLPTANLPQIQPNCLFDSGTGLIDCGNWGESASWSVPANATSGVYIAKLERLDTGGASHIYFIVRDDAGRSDILFQTSDTTWQAYNDFGGNSLYVRTTPTPNANRAYEVSYNRPFRTRGSRYSRAFFFGAEYPMLRWLEANGFNVSYFTGVDSARRGSELLKHRVFLSVGHDEYWSTEQRINVTNARNLGVNLAFFSGNEVFWKTRWKPSIDSSKTPNRTLVSYKETHANAKIDPLPNVWTGAWRDPRFSPPANGGIPENGLTGTLFKVNCCIDGLGIKIPAPKGKFRFWRNTSVARLQPGQTATLPLGVLGYEWDEPTVNEVTPAGLIRLSSTPVSLPSQYLLDYGSRFGTGEANHSLTLYRHKGRGLVFGAGTIRWSWGLDGYHDLDASFPLANMVKPDIRMQQATVNLFADMGIQPQTLQAGLTKASRSADKTPPSVKIDAPAINSIAYACRTNIIRGAATDTAGGKVASVEISTNNGKTWNLAQGSNQWRFSWRPDKLGQAVIRSRAVDDSGNIQNTAPVIVTVKPSTGPCSIWDSATKPFLTNSLDLPDPLSVELGLKFKTDVPGFITGIRFYKNAANTGVHIGNLWSDSGMLLASAPFTQESALGWQKTSFAKPVKIDANKVYVASYFAPMGNYAATNEFFARKGVDMTPLHALANTTLQENGVYAYGSGGFPNKSFNSTNYWVDVIFTPSK